jgi:hypothetical protein
MEVSTMQCAHHPLYDVDPQTGAAIEVFYAGRTLETFGRCGSGSANHLSLTQAILLASARVMARQLENYQS